jgi:putative copper export protein
VSEDAAGDPYAGLRHETPTERSDRNWVELQQVLRVVQTGVQLLTGFLLTLPFQTRFDTLDRFQRAVYLTTLLLAVVALTSFVAPVAYHRALFQRRSKATLVAAASRFARAGLAMVALVLTGGVLLVVDVVAGRAAGIATASGVLLLVVVCWYLLPQRAVRTVEGARRPPAG